MKGKQLLTLSLLTLALATSGCASRNVRSACDITPGNPSGEKLDWCYGAADIRIQTTKVTSTLMDNWCERIGTTDCRECRPRIIITEVDNRTDTYISTDMIRDIFEGAAVEDGRFTIVVGDRLDEGELDSMMDKIQYDPKYNNRTKLQEGKAKAPEFLAKVRISKAVTRDNRFDYEDYRMSVTLYDIETQEIVDSAWDVLKKKVQA